MAKNVGWVERSETQQNFDYCCSPIVGFRFSTQPTAIFEPEFIKEIQNKLKDIIPALQTENESDSSK
ncbi:hypothetical protein [Okeania sp.]|uniref:hypothetical protein n=1 Tax=Okeania sp. TaxID=3100323 RepID=UPI002B4B7696|nr:hypothetical protein [Okeania sp.]MEB3342180.1 hypothetical protein [Okeania sp.]